MDSSFRNTLKSTTKTLLPSIKSYLKSISLDCAHVLIFLKNDNDFSFEDSVSLGQDILSFDNLRISGGVFTEIFPDVEIKFLDNTGYLFSASENNNVDYNNLNKYFYIVYPLSYQKEKIGLILYLCQKGVEISEKEKIMLSLVSQNLCLDLEKRLMFTTLTDIIDKKEKLQQKLEDAVSQKDEFISMAAHELRAPMTAIKGYVSMVLEGDTGDIPEKARGFLADANNINDRLIRLVNNMLNVSRIEEGRMVYQIEDENLSHFVRAVFSQFSPEAERKGLEYKLEIPPHIKDRARIDPDRIQEVIGNLLSNAIKYTDSGSVIVRLSQADEKSVRCEVVDTGIGISKEEQQRLFQKFRRVESNVGKTTGTGLGLYICKLLVERFNGKIGLDSELGKGSTFWFELPLIG